MFLKKYSDFVLGLFFAAFAALLFLGASAIPSTGMEGVGSDFMPKILSAAIGILSVFQLSAGIKNMKKSYEPDAPEDKPEYNRVLATIVSFGIYVFALKPIGFIVSSVIYLFLQMVILAPKEKRNIPLFGVISVVFIVGVYCIFRFGLKVVLPAGIIG